MADNWREIEAEWQGEGAFIGRNSQGGTVQMGKLGDRPGVSPMELLLVGLAGCTGYDVVDILVKKREPLKAVKVKVRAKRVKIIRKFIRRLRSPICFGGGNQATSVERAIELSEEKYCSVSAMLKSVAEIRCTYQIINSDRSR